MRKSINYYFKLHSFLLNDVIQWHIFKKSKSGEDVLRDLEQFPELTKHFPITKS